MGVQTTGAIFVLRSALHMSSSQDSHPDLRKSAALHILEQQPETPRRYLKQGVRSYMSPAKLIITLLLPQLIWAEKAKHKKWRRIGKYLNIEKLAKDIGEKAEEKLAIDDLAEEITKKIETKARQVGTVTNTIGTKVRRARKDVLGTIDTALGRVAEIPIIGYINFPPPSNTGQGNGAVPSQTGNAPVIAA